MIIISFKLNCHSTYIPNSNALSTKFDFKYYTTTVSNWKKLVFILISWCMYSRIFIIIITLGPFLSSLSSLKIYLDWPWPMRCKIYTTILFCGNYSILGVSIWTGPVSKIIMDRGPNRMRFTGSRSGFSG